MTGRLLHNSLFCLFFSALLLFAGCLGFRENLVTVAAVDGSNDHRVFRIASLTKILMEPVLWKLEDTELINFDLPVTVYFKDKLPAEYEQITLRMLHDGKSGLPREFIDPWCLGDVYTAFKCGFVGSNIYADFDTREDFVCKLRDPRIRSAVRHRSGVLYSNMGYVLMMMAICDELGTTPQALCEKYLVEPYGLQDTSFVLKDSMRSRLTPSCAGHLPWFRFAGMEVPDHREGEITMLAGGLLSSASDILKVGYVMLPHLDRSRFLLLSEKLDRRHWVYHRSGMIYGGHAFIGFDTKRKRVAVHLKNVTCWPSDDGLDFMRALYAPED